MNILRVFAAWLLFLTVPGWAAPGDVDPGFDPNPNGEVFAVAVQPDGKIVFGGSFTEIAGQQRSNLVRLNPDGTLDADFAPAVDGTVLCVAVLPDGGMLIGGSIGNVGGEARLGLARLLPNGSPDLAFHPVVGGIVTCIAVAPDGQFIIGGSFQTVDNQPHKNVARFLADGALDASFLVNADFSVSTAVFLPDGKVMMGGRFENVNGQQRFHLARVSALGVLEAGTPVINGEDVDCMAVQPDGRILIGGEFTGVGGVLRSNLARLNADLTLDASFDPNPFDEVQAIALQADGQIIAGGTFQNVTDGIARNYVARFYADGVLDPAFNPNAGGFVIANTLQENGRVLLTGDFAGVGASSRNFVARLQNDAATQSLGAPNPSRVRWLRGDSSPEAQSVTFELSTNGGTTWDLIGNGTRMPGGWEKTGLDLPGAGLLRARARVAGGLASASSGLVETVIQLDTSSPTGGTFTLTPSPPIATGAASVAHFSDWTDASLPLTYEVRANSTIVVPRGANPDPSFTLPSGNNLVELRVYDALGNFTTSAEMLYRVINPLQVTTLEPINVTSTSATLRMTISGQGDVRATFDYGLTTNYDHLSTTTEVGELNGTTSVNIAVSGLTPGATYQFRAIGTNEVDVFRGGNLSFTTAGLGPTHIALYTKGGPVPGAGIKGSGVPADATFDHFGIPSIAGDGQVAFAAHMVSSEGRRAVLVGPDQAAGTAVLIAEGDSVPNENGVLQIQQTFASFGDPLLNNSGDIAFTARISGAGVTSENDLGIWTNESGLLRLVARKGSRARGVSGSAVFKTFKSVALADRISDGDSTPRAPIAFVAKIASTGIDVTTASDLGLWRYIRSESVNTALELVLREGGVLDLNPNDTIPGLTVQSFAALQPQPGAAGHGYGLIRDPHNNPSVDMLARVTFVGGGVAIAEFRTDENLPVRRVARTETSGSLDVPFQSFKNPTQSSDGQDAVIGRRKLNPKTGIDASNNDAVFVANDLDTASLFLQVTEGGTAPDTNGAAFARFQNVVNNGVGVYAVTASIVGPSINASNDTGIWLERFSGFRALAREGAEAPGTGGATFESFLSLAMPGNGRPLIKARVKTTKTAALTTGVWFVDEDSTLRLLIREGDPIPGISGGALRSVSILEEVIGSPTQTRSFNGGGEVIYRAKFGDGGQAIVKSTLPGSSD